MSLPRVRSSKVTSLATSNRHFIWKREKSLLSYIIKIFTKLGIYWFRNGVCFNKKSFFCKIGFSSVQLLSCVRLCDPMDCNTPGLPSITKSQSLLKLMSIELVIPSNHLILCHPLLLLPLIFPSKRVFSCKLTYKLKEWLCYALQYLIKCHLQ